MESFIKELFNPQILDQTLSLFNISKKPEYIGGFENFVYSVHLPGQEKCILRFGHDSHRNSDEVNAELEFINRLKSAGLNVCAPIKSVNNRFCEILPAEQGYFTAVLFERAPGARIGAEHFNNSYLAESFGRLGGAIHRVSRDIQVNSDNSERFTFIQDVEKWLKYTDLVSKNRAREIENMLEKAADLDRQAHFGLVHCDMHMGNFHVDQSSIHLFDFDDSCYTSFINDLAIVFYYLLPKKGTAYLPVEDSSNFLKQFLKGYFSEYKLPIDQFMHVPFYMRLRDCFLNLIFRAVKKGNQALRSKNTANESWLDQAIDETDQRIDTPSSYPDFSLIENSLKRLSY